MSETKTIRNIEELLTTIEHASRGTERVSFGMVLDAIGRRSFGPILLLAGLIISAPVVGDIPGVPTITGLLVLIVAAQLLLRREHFWFPDWLLRRSAKRTAVLRAARWLRKPAAYVDSIVHPRLTRFVRGRGSDAVAVACTLLVFALPVMEFIPFSANLAGAAFVLFGLALIANDGALACAAFVLVLIGAGAVSYFLIAG